MIKSIKAIMRQDREQYRVPRRVQDVIPIQAVWPDGIFKVGNKFSKTYRFSDINYMVASREDKEGMFLTYSELLNSLDSTATTKLTICNHRQNRASFEQSILMPMRGDGLDEYRREYNQMLIDKATGANGITQEKYLYDYTFAHDNGQNPVMAKARAYVEHWAEAFKKNVGLLLFGDVGTGKSFLAGCIANALLDQDVPVLMTNFPTILARLSGTFGADRADFLASLGDYDLLIIDDLGVERGTEYALEQVFSIIDSRYRSGKPLIVTANLKLDELKHPPDLAHARIYDRILERCAPILFAGKNFREDNAASTKAAAREIVTDQK